MISEIEFGDKVQFRQYERAPFAVAKDFIEYNNKDGSSGRTYEIPGTFNIDDANPNTW